jgi:CTP synthase (UTP-ammonia lyase)
MAISARDGTGEVRAVERPGHPFFLATLNQPHLTSTPGDPHPIFSAFVAAVASRR